ncbi:MAG: hypothetical protein QMD61_11625, partial [Methanobacterium sp.]|nr:hypothetical protein [Methanobacterium sp.]
MRVKTEKPKKDWSKFIEAKKEKDYTTAGKELEKALYEYMEREGWDFENERFIDFNDNDENNFLNRTKHTHIDQDQDPRSIGEDVDLTEQSRSEPSESEHNPVNNENSNNEAPIEAAAIPEQTQFIKVRTPTNEEVFTYAFCKLFANLHEVNYEQIEQLA